MKLDWRSEWPAWLMLVLLFVLAAASWNAVPDSMPVHWGITGEADRWGGKFEGLALLPCVALCVYVGMAFLPKIDPGRANYVSFAGAYHTVRLLVITLMLALEVCIVLAARGSAIDMKKIVMLVIGASFIVMGNLFGKLRPNWFIGIRTPWTLSSKLAWTKTHRAGGWMFIVLGVLLMATSLARSPVAMVVVLLAGGVGVIALTAYSFVVWKNDPDKTAPAGTTPGEPRG